MLLALSSIPALAQLTILNVPSADVTISKSIYERTDMTYRPSNAQSTLTPNFMFGTGRGTELDLNANTVSHPENQPLSIESGFKSAYALVSSPSSTDGFVVFGGTKFSNTVRNTAGNFSSYTYIATAMSYGKSRFTSGMWNSYNYTAQADRVGAFLGYEYKFNGKYTVASDWSSGSGSNGVTTTGLMWFPNSRLMIIPSYQVGNSGVSSGNHQAVLYVGMQLK